ncbi:hypothetical protein MAP00_006821 [Monascus purpureus]|nr:hypothetical protein MAP00_006821 [Monascus purpureus]
MTGSQNCEVICRDMSLRLDLDSTAIVWEEVAVYLEPQANRKTEKLATLSSGILAAAIGLLGFRFVKWQRQANDFS